jgi:hypothetical protein
MRRTVGPVEPGTPRRRRGMGRHRRRAAVLPVAAGTAAALAAALGAGPAAAQWREGQAAHPAPALETAAGKLAGYALMVDAAAERLRAVLAMLVAHGAREPQEGAIPPAQQALLDEAISAWMVINDVPGDFGDRAAYEAAERQFRESIAAMQVATTSPREAAEEAQKVLAAMRMLERSAAAAARAKATTTGQSR